MPVPPGDTLAFRLVRHGSEIGRHTLGFTAGADGMTVHIAVDARVTFLSIPIVRYHHRVVETWQGDTLLGLDGTTDRNGRHQWAKAHRAGGGLEVQGSQTAHYIAPEGAIGTSYWNKRMLDGPMISLEDGVLLRPKVEARGRETIPLASGATIAADRYNLSGAFNVDVWYDSADTWASLAFTVADGSTVHYERL